MSGSHWQDWREDAEDVCALPLVRRLAALLDHDPAAFRAGDALPQGWHVLLFTPLAPQSTLGPDGHPAATTFLAPPGLPRRLLGGRRTRFEAPLRIGATVHRTSDVARVDEKQGRSGRLAIVTIRHSITEAGQSDPAVIEEQDVIYREAAGGDAPLAAAVPQPETERPTPSHTRTVIPDPTLLFRYSAITFNAHRIHYDHDYATGPEGYPGLIVNGGLTALLLLELAKTAVGRPLTRMDVRNRRTLLCNRPMRLCAAPAVDSADGGWSLWAEDDEGRLALEASAA